MFTMIIIIIITIMIMIMIMIMIIITIINKHLSKMAKQCSNPTCWG